MSARGSARWIVLPGALAMGLLLTACKSKSVNIITDPPGAQLKITQLVGAVRTDVTPRPEPMTALSDGKWQTSLSFGNGEQYEVVASLPQHVEERVIIRYAPQDQTDYRMNLVRFQSNVASTVFVPRLGEGKWHLGTASENTLAYLREPDKRPLGPEAGPHLVSSSFSQVTRNVDPAVDIRSLALSPTADLLIYTRVSRKEKPATTYQVRPGPAMTFGEIAAETGVPEAEIAAANPGAGITLRSGVSVRIPRHEIVSQLLKRDLNAPAESTGVRITPDECLETSPAFSFGGEFIVFSADSLRPNAGLFRVKADGRDASITSLAGSADELNYEPSIGQEKLAYTSLPPRSQEPQIFVSRLDGSNATRLAEGHSPQMSPDDRRILFLGKARGTDGDVKRRLCVMNIDGSDVRRIADDVAYEIIDPRWSPDGNWIAYASNEARDASGARNYDIWAIRADGSGKIRLTTNASYDSYPVWDRTQRFLYYRSNRGGCWNIWRLEVQLPK